MADDDDRLAQLVDEGAPDADAQRSLVSFLLERGVPFEAVRDARASGSIANLVIATVLWSDPSRISLSQLAARTGLSEAETLGVRRMYGFVDPGPDTAYPVREVDMIRAFAAGAALFGDDRTAQISRVFGTSTSAIAEAAISLFTGSVAAPMRAAGATDAEFGLALRDAMVAFESVCVAVDVMLRLNFERAIRRLGQDEAVDSMTFAIAFVDVVDSTAMSGERPSGEVASALRDFDRVAAAAAVRNDVRLVKLIGDGAMLAAREVAPLARAVAEIVGEVGEHPVLRAAKGGVTFGAVAAHDGDYFGQVVNLAARVSSAASPREVLLDTEAANQLRGEVERAGAHALKGFPEPVTLYRLTSTS
jgi:adenylate cyclase